MASARDFAVRVDDDPGGVTVVGVTGDLDLATAGELEAALEKQSPAGRIVVDLTECEFLDSSGIQVLLRESTRTEAAGGSLVLVAHDPRILRVLEVAGVDSRLTIHATREAAR